VLDVRPVDFRWKTFSTNPTLEDVNTASVHRERTMEMRAMVCSLFCSIFALPAAAEGLRFQGKGLDAIAPLLGKTWVGEDTNAAGERTTSVEKWEWILGGKAAQLRASVNKGELGYQYTFYIDPITHGLSFHGVSTDGATVKGMVQITAGKMIWRERIVGSPYLDLVKLTFTLLPDGNMTSSSEYFKGKTSVPGGHEFRYHADPDAKLVFTETSKP
jgi:hypothetical protein